jgi:uncharacterized membrane protein
VTSATPRRHRTPTLQPNVPSIDPTMFFAIGILLLLACLILIFNTPSPEGPRLATFIIVLAAAAALVMHGFLGNMQVTTKWVKATGSSATFIFVCLFTATVSDQGFGGLASLFYDTRKRH